MNLYPSQGQNRSNTLSPSAPSSASSSQLSTLSDLLATGDKHGAANYAAQHSLWSHALVIASSVDPELWRDMVRRFAEDTLKSADLGGMKASYLLFAGVGASAPATLAGGSQIVDELYAAANITDDPSNDRWKDVLGAIMFNGRSSDAVYLDELGQKLMKKGLANAASAW